MNGQAPWSEPISLIYWFWGTSDAAEANEGQLLGYWDSDSNQVIRLVNCIQNCKNGEIMVEDNEFDTGGSSWVECSSIAIQLVTVAILLVAFSFLIAFQVQKYGCKNRDLYRKTKTHLLVYTLVYMFLILLNNLFTTYWWPWGLYVLIQVGIALLRQLSAISLFKYFYKRTRKLLPANDFNRLDCIYNMMRWKTVICLISITAAFITKAIKVKQAPEGDPKNDEKFLCHSWATISISLSWIVITVSMSMLTHKIKQMTLMGNKQLSEQLQQSHEAQIKQRKLKQLVSVREKQVRRMQVFNWMLITVAILMFFYTAYKYLFYSADCNPRNSMSLEVNALFNFLGQGFDFIFWLIPIAVFFWPTKAHKKEERIYRRARRRWSSYSSRSSANSIQNAQDDSSSSESEESSDLEPQPTWQGTSQDFGLDLHDPNQLLGRSRSDTDRQKQNSKLGASGMVSEQRSLSNNLEQPDFISKFSSRNESRDNEFSEENRSVAFIGVQNPSEKMTQEQARLLQVLKKRYQQSQSSGSHLGNSTQSRSDN